MVIRVELEMIRFVDKVEETNIVNNDSMTR